MRILFLYATQAVLRKAVYIEASRRLANDYGHEVVFCYNGPEISGIDDLCVEHFDSWVARNGPMIEGQNLRSLERRFPESNLWRSVVIERNLADYSFVGASFATSRYSLKELEWYLKALVLFYDYVMERYGIEVAFNQVSDNIHAHVISELASAKGVVSLSVGRGIYWFNHLVYPQTEASFGSPALRDRYRRVRRNSKLLKTILTASLTEDIEALLAVEAREECPTVIYTKSVFTITRNALVTLREHFRHLTLRRPPILLSNLYVNLWHAVGAYMIRLRNIAAMRSSVRRKDLPADPYVFFPLHYQPEATLLAASPGWLDQLALARLLSASLPGGYLLLVKDHPIIGGTRPPSFYKALKRLANVVLVDERLSARRIVRAPACSLVATIGGTVALEAMLYGKPVLIFGRAYYDCIDALLKPPADINDLPMFMKRILVFEEHPSAEEIAWDVRTFLAAWISMMAPAGKATAGVQEDEVGAGRDWAKLVDAMARQVRPDQPRGEYETSE